MSPKKIDNIPKSKYNLRNNKKQELKRGKQDSDSDSSDEDSEEDSDYDSDSEYETIDETSDSTYVPSPKRKTNKKKSSKSKNNKRSNESDESSQDEESDDSENSDEDDEELDQQKLRKIISQIFPSKYMNNKVKKDKKMKKMQKVVDDDSDDSSSSQSSEDDEDTYDDSSEDEKLRRKKAKAKKSPKKSSKHSKKTKKSPKKKREETSDSDEYSTEYSSGSETCTDDEVENVNLIFTLDASDAKDYESYFREEDENEEAMRDDEPLGVDDEKTFMKENYQEVTVPEEDTAKENENSSDDCKKCGNKKTKKNDKKNAKKDSEKDKAKTKNADGEDTDSQTADIEKEYLELLDMKKVFTEKLQKKPKSKILRKAIQECTDSINKLIKSARTKNTRLYHKLTQGEKRTNEIDYFKKKLSNKEQLRIMQELKEINQHIYIEKPYRLSLLQSKMPAKFKAIAMQKLNALKNMEPGDPEYHKIKNWVDNFMKIPFGVNKDLSVRMDDGIDVCNNFISNAKKTLDDCVYGLEDAKLQIMQMIGQWIANPAALGTAIAIKGPPGTGKTSLVKDGISKILGREFAFIALGGTGDSSFLEGHSYTYEGSTWGKIVQILMDSKCMNPVIYFDELDKVSDTPRGQEIIGILTHLTDTSQNNQFHDKYFSEIDFDLSKCLFIFSYNDEHMVNPILRDRMYRIETKGYDSKDKVIIAKNYLLPKIRLQVNFTAEEIIIPDETIQFIISTEGYTKKEDGVRNLKRCLEIVHTKLNLFRLVKPEANIFGKNIELNVTFPFTVTQKHVEVLIKNEENQRNSILYSMYI